MFELVEEETEDGLDAPSVSFSSLLSFSSRSNISGLGESPNLRQASNTGVRYYQGCYGVFKAGLMTRRQEGGCELIDRTEE